MRDLGGRAGQRRNPPAYLALACGCDGASDPAAQGTKGFWVATVVQCQNPTPPTPADPAFGARGESVHEAAASSRQTTLSAAVTVRTWLPRVQLTRYRAHTA